MPPKAPRKKEDSTVVILPAISPVLSAAQSKFDKWVKRVQDLLRAKSEVIRLKSSYVLSLREGESRIRALDLEAENVAFSPLRPPPSPPPQSLSPVPPPSKPVRKSLKGSPLPESVPESWRPPEPIEAKRLQKAAEALMAVYYTKKGGPEKPPEVDKKRSGLQKRKEVTVDVVMNLAPSSQAPEEDAHTVPLTPHLVSSAPTVPTQQKGKKGKDKTKELESERDIGQKPVEAQVLVSMSLATGSAVVMGEPLPSEVVPLKKVGKSPREDKGKKEISDKVLPQPVVNQSSIPILPPIHGPSAEEGTGLTPSGSFKGLDGLCSSPPSDGMEKPKGATLAQWNRILQLRQERLEIEDTNVVARSLAMEARDRIAQLKEVESISRYSLLAAQKELESLTGSSIGLIPGVSGPTVVPQPPGTPRAMPVSAAGAPGSGVPSAAPESNQHRAITIGAR